MDADFAPTLQPGRTCLLISVPHAGQAVPEFVSGRMSEVAKTLPDTDWFVDRLYQWAPEMGAGMITAPASRYVIDLNRPPDDAPLYDQATSSLLTGLVPTHTFAGERLYRDGFEPDEQEIGQRLQSYWFPYHDCLGAELARIVDRFGHAVLLDAHSIRSRQPLLFDGVLPDFNLGSNNGASAAASLVDLAWTGLKATGLPTVLDGRFKGGYITRHYGNPVGKVHALQLEMAQSAYMEEDPPEWNPARAESMQAHLRRFVQALMKWSPGHD